MHDGATFLLDHIYVFVHAPDFTDTRPFSVLLTEENLQELLDTEGPEAALTLLFLESEADLCGRILGEDRCHSLVEEARARFGAAQGGKGGLSAAARGVV